MRTEGTGFVVRNQSSGELVIITANHVAMFNEPSQALSRHLSTAPTTSLLCASRTSFYRPSSTHHPIQNAVFLFSPSQCKMINASCASLMALPLFHPLNLRLRFLEARYACSRTPCFCNSKKATNLPLQQVFVVGFPGFGSALTLSEGLISQVDPHQHQFWILSDGVTTQGGSGSPLLHKDRSFVGVVLAINKTTGNFVEVLPYWKLMPFLV